MHQGHGGVLIVRGNVKRKSIVRKGAVLDTDARGGEQQHRLRKRGGIRALARDLGEALGSGAFLSSLRRTKNGGYDISQALSLGKALEMLG